MSPARPNIHPTAIVDPGARLAAALLVGQLPVLGTAVEIGPGCRGGAHALLQGPTRIGSDNHIGAYASIGGDPQDKKYRGERSELVIGNYNEDHNLPSARRASNVGEGPGAG